MCMKHRIMYQIGSHKNVEPVYELTYLMQTYLRLDEDDRLDRCIFLELKRFLRSQSDTIHRIYHRQSQLSGHTVFCKCSTACFDPSVTATFTSIRSTNKKRPLSHNSIAVITFSSSKQDTGKRSPSDISSKTLYNSSTPPSLETCLLFRERESETLIGCYRLHAALIKHMKG